MCVFHFFMLFLFATCLTRFCHRGPGLQHNSHLPVDFFLELSSAVLFNEFNPIWILSKT